MNRGELGSGVPEQVFRNAGDEEGRSSAEAHKIRVVQRLVDQCRAYGIDQILAKVPEGSSRGDVLDLIEEYYTDVDRGGDSIFKELSRIFGALMIAGKCGDFILVGELRSELADYLKDFGDETVQAAILEFADDFGKGSLKQRGMLVE